jgi:hypothetical protein
VRRARRVRRVLGRWLGAADATAPAEALAPAPRGGRAPSAALLDRGPGLDETVGAGSRD